MTTLLYRGHDYVQNKKVAEKQPVDLTYRRSVYKSRKIASASSEGALLNYRGVKYKR